MSLSLVKAIFINRAPFEHLVLDFKEKGINVLSAINGKGKTTILSHIVDAFYELAKKVYYFEFDGKSNQYYRISSPLFNLNFSQPSIVYLRFKLNSTNIDYVDIRNECSESQYNNYIGIENKIAYNMLQKTLTQEANIKYWSLLDKEVIKQIFTSNLLTFFPSYRYEIPGYLNDSHKINFSHNVGVRFAGYLPNPIEVVSSLKGLANWMLDVVLDNELQNRALNKILQELQPYIVQGEKGTNVLNNSKSEKLLAKLRIQMNYPQQSIIKNINMLFSKALYSKFPNRNLSINVGERAISEIRLSIRDAETDELIYPNIFNMSSGECEVIAVFMELLRQMDNFRIQNNAMHGIVLIDEVDKNLHIKMQKEVLPELFNIFPNIQFIVSSHSPFLNMGLADTLVERSQIIDLDNNGITCSPTNNDLYKEVYEMMVGENDQFAKKYYKLEDTLKAIKKPLVITEGKTDIKFIQKAKEALGLNDVNFDVIAPDQQPDGDSNLQKMLEQLCKIERPFPIIGIFDRDVDGVVRKVDIGDTRISIEYLFSDEEIMSPVNETGCRLFFGTEFTQHSMRHNEHKNLILNKPDGKTLDKILENNGGQAVYDENDNNILAKKDDFANAVVSGYLKISDESWENFRPILEKIKNLSEL